MANWTFSRVKVTRIDPRFKNIGFAKRVFGRRMEKLQKEITLALRKAMEVEIRRTKFYKNLVDPPIGTRGYDLPAEFGLRPGMEILAAETLIKILELTINCKASFEDGVRSIKRSGFAQTIRVEISFLNPEKYEGVFNSYPFVYDSINKKGSTRIPWMRWVLNASKGNNALVGINPDVRDYSIVYDLDARQRPYSRSGRALMIQTHRDRQLGVPLTSRRYNFPEGAKPTDGRKNFIESLSKNDVFVNKLKSIAERQMEKILKLG